MQILFIKTDGGPDRNPTFVAVQLAAMSLAMSLGCKQLVLMRTAAGQSYVNNVERCMSVLNLGLQGIATARELCPPETETILKDVNSMKERRIALASADGERADEPDSHTSNFAQSMQAPIDTITEAFQACPLLCVLSHASSTN